MTLGIYTRELDAWRQGGFNLNNAVTARVSFASTTYEAALGKLRAVLYKIQHQESLARQAFDEASASTLQGLAVSVRFPQKLPQTYGEMVREIEEREQAERVKAEQAQLRKKEALPELEVGPQNAGINWRIDF